MKKLASIIYNIVTTAIVSFIFITIFFTYHLVSFKGLGIFIASLVFLDIFCTLIESNLEEIREKLFYKKLKRKSQKEKEKKIKEEQKKAIKDLEESEKNSDYKSILEAESFVKSLNELSDNYSFGPNNDKINICVEKLSEIIDILKKDSSGYTRVAFLFEAYLPEFYNTLSFYSNFVRADTVKKEHEEILTICVDKFLNFLNNQKIDAIFDQKSIEIQFKSTAEALGKMIDKGE